MSPSPRISYFRSSWSPKRLPARRSGLAPRTHGPWQRKLALCVIHVSCLSPPPAVLVAPSSHCLHVQPAERRYPHLPALPKPHTAPQQPLAEKAQVAPGLLTTAQPRPLLIAASQPVCLPGRSHSNVSATAFIPTQLHPNPARTSLLPPSVPGPSQPLGQSRPVAAGCPVY